MCAAKTTNEQDLLAALGVTLSPAPLGGTSARVRGGDIPTFEVELAASTFTRGDLDARLGEPQKLPRTGPGAPHNLAYAVDVAGVPHRCTVFARFASEPQPSTPVASVMFRLDPARA